MQEHFDISKYIRAVENVDRVRLCGNVTRVIGLVIESRGPAVSVGDICYIESNRVEEPIVAEVVGFRDNNVLLMPFGDMRGVAPGSRVISTGRPLTIGVGNALLGRVLDGYGNPLDDKGPILASDYYSTHGDIPDPLSRTRIEDPLVTGIRAIDSMITCGKGQRIGIFAGSGVGKSTLLGCVSKFCNADVIVVGLIGERGREVRDFIEDSLGEEGLKRSVVVVATSDQPSLVRINGALIATSVAEYFRDQGKDVLLVMDSITRLAMAQREVGLAIGEPPTTKGYTPSVFSLLPQVLERSGTAARGSITGIYTVLVEGDDLNDPIADSARSILDGHIVLSRALADSGHYPPIDVLQSVSRLMTDVASQEHIDMGYQIRDLLAVYREAEDLINIGAYKAGTNAKIDRAVLLIDELRAFLRQGMQETTSFDETIGRLRHILSQG